MHSTSGHTGIGFPRIYDALLFALTRGKEDAYRRTIIDIAGIGSGSHVLDIGCGTGTQAVIMAARVQPGGSVTGLDVNPNMVAAARRKTRRATGSITIVEGDCTAVPFADGRFDVVTVTTVLHMLSEADQAICLAEAKRVLKPDGRLLLIDYAGDTGSRRHLSARHGPHGKFDLHRLRDSVAALGMHEIETGELGWLSLSYIAARRPASDNVSNRSGPQVADTA
jgi:SAM-dependent methyltransferase